MHTDYSPPSALHIIGNQSPLSFHLEANAFKVIKLLTIYLNLKEPNETSLQDEIDFALWLSCTCDTLCNVNFSIGDWRSVSQLCDAAVSHRGEDAAALKLKVKVTYSQVCWPTLRIRALHLPIQVHTHSSEHTHTVNTHPEQWAAFNAAAPRDSNSQPLDYESNSLPLDHDFPDWHMLGEMFLICCLWPSNIRVCVIKL